MEILGISQAQTCGSGVLYEIETIHTIDNDDYIITWGYSSQKWHKFKGIRHIGQRYKKYDTRDDVETKFKGKKKKNKYLGYLDKIIDELKNKTKLDKALSLFNQEDLIFYDDLNSLIKKVIINQSQFDLKMKKKIILNRTSYIIKKYGSIDGYKLYKLLN